MGEIAKQKVEGFYVLKSDFHVHADLLKDLSPGKEAHDVEQVAGKTTCYAYVVTLDKTVEAVKKTLFAERTVFQYCNGVLYGQKPCLNVLSGGERCNKNCG